MSTSSLYTLPIELIYYLLEYLDLSTILFSFRYVCKRFQTIVDSYDQYKLDLRLISKTDFDHICHVISPKKVLSIILTNDIDTPYQIRTFLSRFSFEQFSRLQSLDLLKIDENNLFSILKHISNCSLKSLSIDSKSSDKFSYTTRVLLSSTIAKLKLEKLDLNVSYKDLYVISRSPLPTTLKYLRLESCTFQEYYIILRHATNLHKLILKECHMYDSDGTMYKPSDVIYPSKLKSLSFGTCYIRMKELSILLSCTPTLNHMKLILWTDLCDPILNGNQWENFIVKKLPLLNKFEFFFNILNYINRNSLINIHLFINSFQTSFWLEKKHWYVACDYMKTLFIIRLYSLPICNSLLTYYTNSKKISCSTLNTTSNHIKFTDHVRELKFNLNQTIEINDEIQNNQLKDPIFRKITHLSLNLDGKLPYVSLQSLQTIIDLSSLVCLSMQILIYNVAQRSSVTDYISSILKKTSNIHSLKLIYNHTGESLINIETLSSIIPRSIKHLQISITNLDEMKNILEKLKQLSSVIFYSVNMLYYYEDIIKWIKLKRKNSLCRKGLRCMQIWLGACSMNDDNEKNSMKKVFRRIRHKQISYY
ncbi:unnamed protein product [Rotaria sp. Silwood1]|nr:unnamed protein product [Rotaria sp. Silwood1]CAF4613602.1 unnamed protein product [Rotaria sp. Silwood1]